MVQPSILILTDQSGPQVGAQLQQTADPLPCPANPFRAGTPFEATCRGGAGYNGFYGHGQVNALEAVTR